MRRTPWIIGLIAPVLIGVRAIAEEGVPASPEVIPLQKCTIDYERSTLVGPNQNVGRIQECLVRPGDRVKGGQVLGRLFNKDVQAELGSRIAGFESSGIMIDQREAALQVERAKLRRIENLRNRDALLTSIQDLQIQQLAVKTAELELQAAIQNRRMAESMVQQAKAQLAAREIVSPHDGVVVEIYKNVGEAITAVIPIYKVVAIDRMRVTGYLDTGDAWRVHQGQAARIMPELEGGDLPIEREVFEGKITFVDSEMDPKTRTCRIFAEVENRGDLLRSGLDCRMEIDLRNPSGTRAEATGSVLGRPADTEAPPRSVPRTSGEGLAREGRK
ncbi:MAG: efflux RND transporter periplasmic adaptor subunit [Planctomycetaceae bacterium]|nr:efflux RND transporter periplasmic adaptor subunit [Planctomycetaceae bacterium]